MWWFVSLLACAPSSGDPACREGYTLEADGHCYPPADPPPDLQEAIDALPACEPRKPLGSWDAYSGCADDLCPDRSFVVADLTATVESECIDLGDGNFACNWRGAEGVFADADADGAPDPDAITPYVHLRADYPGATDTGLGVGVPMSCYFDQFGNPNEIHVWLLAGELRVRQLDYDFLGLYVYDTLTDDGDAYPDGVVDDVYHYGAL